jgi:predicted DNA-binding protein
MEEKSSTYTMRVPEDLKKAFEHCAKQDDQSGAQLVRKWMRMYVEDFMKRNAQADMLRTPKGRK